MRTDRQVLHESHVNISGPKSEHIAPHGDGGRCSHQDLSAHIQFDPLRSQGVPSVLYLVKNVRMDQTDTCMAGVGRGNEWETSLIRLLPVMLERVLEALFHLGSRESGAFRRGAQIG